MSLHITLTEPSHIWKLRTSSELSRTASWLSISTLASQRPTIDWANVMLPLVTFTKQASNLLNRWKLTQRTRSTRRIKRYWLIWRLSILWLKKHWKKRSTRRLLSTWIVFLKNAQCPLIGFVWSWSVSVDPSGLTRPILFQHSVWKKICLAEILKFCTGEEKYWLILEMKWLERSILLKLWTSTQTWKTAKKLWRTSRNLRQWRKKLLLCSKAATTRQPWKPTINVWKLTPWTVITTPPSCSTSQSARINLATKEKHYTPLIKLSRTTLSTQKHLSKEETCTLP